VTFGGKNPDKCCIILNGNKLEWIEKLTYLGCQSFSHSCKVDFSTNIRKFYGGLNNIISVVGKNRNEISCVHLVKTYCVPSLLYGCEVWNLSCAEYRHLNVDLEKNLIVVGGRARGSCCFTVRSYLWHI